MMMLQVMMNVDVASWDFHQIEAKGIEGILDYSEIVTEAEDALGW
jgi:hypothetical protein